MRRLLPLLLGMVPRLQALLVSRRALEGHVRLGALFTLMLLGGAPACACGWWGCSDADGYRQPPRVYGYKGSAECAHPKPSGTEGSTPHSGPRRRSGGAYYVQLGHLAKRDAGPRPLPVRVGLPQCPAITPAPPRFADGNGDMADRRCTVRKWVRQGQLRFAAQANSPLPPGSRVLLG